MAATLRNYSIMRHRILLVDDEPNLLQGLKRTLRSRYDIATATDGAEALAVIGRDEPFAVVVSDMRMPGMDGVALLARIRDLAPHTVRVMLTGNNDQVTAARAVNEGSIFRFVNKPCSHQDLIVTIDAAIRQHQLLIAEKQLLEQTLAGSIGVLTELLELSDTRLFSRCTSMRERCHDVATLIPKAEVWQVESAAMLLPIGSIAIPPVVMVRKRQGHSLTGAERDMIARIPELGFELLNRIPRLDGVAAIVRYQDKDYDGGGLPHDSVAGRAIPFGARLLRILRDLAMLEEDGQSRSQAFAGMRTRTVYDPELLAGVADCLGSTWQDSVDHSEAVALGALRLQHVTAADILTTEGTVLVAAGQTITRTILERLQNFAATVGIREPIQVFIAVAHAAS